MADIKVQMLLYHLTSISNIGLILAEGLKPRSELVSFEDVADQEIIASRRHLSLEDYVPFHWFARNPFDGRVQADRPDELFVLITVRRTLAVTENWKIIPHHPLAAANIELMDYAEGFAVIDWDAMNNRDYHDPHSKSVCMAECLSPTTVSPVNFFKIFVPCDASAASVEQEKLRHGERVEVTVNGHMFLS
ncbi:MAG: DarT ssDNA thymidine ADP-ribosyltransferase family protein [Methylotenera sp.]|nr:DarT ssDNA thymidine ADP-ribosyltransferase family protein [Methylotenera sp.]MDD4926146.1 DarT ssDNA thymidine ADP-ribosyltransferase family protein [Methylotenera sp.]